LAKPVIKDGSLYLVLSEEYGGGRPVMDVAGQAIAGGIDILQMREKQKSRQDLLALGIALASLCKRHEVLFIVNDDPRLARELNADGVHIGQEDMAHCPLEQVRRIVGSDRIIGVSTHSLAQFRQANGHDVDYIAFGPIFPTRTKDYHIGTGDIEKVLMQTLKPVVFIGGIHQVNLQGLLDRGVRHVALIRGVMEAANIKASAAWYKKSIIRMRGGAA
jgi:thiamine-phosphate pyrophosphorylase